MIILCLVDRLTESAYSNAECYGVENSE